MENPSQSYGASPAVWDHTPLPATRHRWTRPTLTIAKQTGTRFTYPAGMGGWVDLELLIYLLFPAATATDIIWSVNRAQLQVLRS